VPSADSDRQKGTLSPTEWHHVQELQFPLPVQLLHPGSVQEVGHRDPAGRLLIAEHEGQRIQAVTP
jgi:PIN domain nuclease of toxin-antitoxin system